MAEALRVGIAGLGTVGASVVNVLATKADELTRQCGRPHCRVSSSAFVASTLTTEAPTVPRPAIPTRNASAIVGNLLNKHRKQDQRRVESGTTLLGCLALSVRNFLIERAAWRIRCSFSTKARRT